MTLLARRAIGNLTSARIRSWAGPVVLLLIALLLRLAGLYKSVLWYDELLSLHRAKLPFWEHMTRNLNLWELALRFFADPVLLRWPAMICSLLAIWLAWRIMGLLNFNKIQRTAGMLALAALPGLLWIAQDARYYSGVALIYMASIYFALEHRWLGLFAVSGLAVFIHPTAPAYIVPAWLLILRSAPRKVLLGSLLLIPIWSLRMINLGGVSQPDFWLGSPTFIDYVALFGYTIGAGPANALPALLFMALALAFCALRFRPAAWVIFLAPLVVLMGVTALIQPVATYRTLQPSLMGLGLLIGSAVPKGRSAWLYCSLAALLCVMFARYDPSLHGGHLDQGAARVREAWWPGDCIQYGDEFSRVSAGFYLYGLPNCKARDHTWLIINQADPARIEVAHTDAWHFTPIYFYPPLDSNFVGESGPEHTVPATSSP